MVAPVISVPASASLAIVSRNVKSSNFVCSHRMPGSISSSLTSPYGDPIKYGFSSKSRGLRLTLDEKSIHDASTSYGAIRAGRENPPLMPAVFTPGGSLDIAYVLFRNRMIFIGERINSLVAQSVISQLVTLATIDQDADILLYINCPGGGSYDVLSIYDCMSWIKPKVGTVVFGMAASHAVILLAGGEKGMRYAMPNARIMLAQPYGGFEGDIEDVKPRVQEQIHNRNKFDRMYAAFTGQPVELIQHYTDSNKYLYASEALELGLIDGILETES